MPSPLADARRHLADYLDTVLDLPGCAVYSHVPEELVGTVIAIDGADNYLQLGDTYEAGEAWLTLQCWALVDLVGNEQATEDLDTALAALLRALVASDWDIENVGRPGPVNSAEWIAHGIPITVTNLVTF